MMIKIIFGSIKANKKKRILTLCLFSLFVLALNFMRGISASVPVLVNKMDLEINGNISIQLTNRSESFGNVKQKLKNFPQITQIYAWSFQKVSIDSDKGSDLVYLFAPDFKNEPYLKDWITLEKNSSLPKGPDEIVLDRFYQRSLGLSIGDTVYLTGVNDEGIFNTLPFRISGFCKNFAIGIKSFITPEAQQILFQNDKSQYFRIFTKGDTAGLKKALQKIFSLAEIKSHKERMQDFERHNNIAPLLNGVTAFLYLIVFIAAGALIAMISYLEVIRRTREMGTYMAMGMKPHSVVTLIQGEQLIIVTLAIIAGILLNIVAVEIFRHIKVVVSFGNWLTGYLRPETRTGDYIFTAVFFELSTIFWVLFPSLKIARMSPIKALHKR